MRKIRRRSCKCKTRRHTKKCNKKRGTRRAMRMRGGGIFNSLSSSLQTGYRGGIASVSPEPYIQPGLGRSSMRY